MELSVLPSLICNISSCGERFVFLNTLWNTIIDIVTCQDDDSCGISCLCQSKFKDIFTFWRIISFLDVSVSKNLAINSLQFLSTSLFFVVENTTIYPGEMFIFNSVLYSHVSSYNRLWYTTDIGTLTKAQQVCYEFYYNLL